MKAPKQLKLGLDAATTCACGQERQRHRLLCSACWAAAPREMRAAFLGSPDEAPGGHLAATRRLIEWARARKAGQ